MIQVLRTVRNWFFEKGDPRTPALLRIAYCALCLLILWDFHPAMPLLFGHRGLMGTVENSIYDLRGFQYALFYYDSPMQLEIWFWATIGVTTLALAGFATRFSMLLTFLSMILFRERDPFMTFGADLVMNCMGVWLLFLDCGRVWSVDRLIRSHSGTSDRTQVELWPARAIQIQVALIYFVTFVKKVITQPWQDGSAVYYAVQVGNVMKGRPVPWMVHHHGVMMFMTYSTLVIEMGAPFLFFFRGLRLWAMAACFLMHTGIDMYMSIRFFSLAMYVCFLSFIDSRFWTNIGARFQASDTVLLLSGKRGPKAAARINSMRFGMRSRRP